MFFLESTAAGGGQGDDQRRAAEGAGRTRWPQDSVYVSLNPQTLQRNSSPSSPLPFLPFLRFCSEKGCQHKSQMLSRTAAVIGRKTPGSRTKTHIPPPPHHFSQRTQEARCKPREETCFLSPSQEAMADQPDAKRRKEEEKLSIENKGKGRAQDVPVNYLALPL